MANQEREDPQRKVFEKYGLTPETFSTGQAKQEILDEIAATSDPVSKIEWARLFIELASKMGDPDVELIEGIKIIEKVDQRPEKEDCFRYLFGADASVVEVTDWMFSECELSDEPSIGAYALYFTREIKPTHVARVIGKDKLISKWGPDGNVMEHKPFQVPLEYGSYIAYFAPPKPPAN